MTQVIVHTNQNGGVSVTYPTPEYLESNTIETVLVKDCPQGAIIVNESDLPQGEDAYFDAWELVNGKVTVNETKKTAIISSQQTQENAKTSAQSKLAALGLTADEIAHLIGVE